MIVALTGRDGGAEAVAREDEHVAHEHELPELRRYGLRQQVAAGLQNRVQGRQLAELRLVVGLAEWCGRAA